MLQVSIGSNYSDDDSTHESGSREGRGRGDRESSPRGEREGKKEEVATKESEEREGRKQLGDIGALRQDFTAMPQ